MEDKLNLAQCHFNCHIGITEEERVKTQPIIIDIELHLNTKTAGRSGELHDSLDYRLAHEAVKTLVEKKSFTLIEAMAEETAALLLRDFKIEKVQIRVQKIEPMVKRGGAWVGVEITRP